MFDATLPAAYPLLKLDCFSPCSELFPGRFFIDGDLQRNGPSEGMLGPLISSGANRR
jgi:hypothetical protein